MTESQAREHAQARADSTGEAHLVYRVTVVPGKYIVRSSGGGQPSPARYEQVAVIRPADALNAREVFELRTRVAKLGGYLAQRPAERRDEVWSTACALVAIADDACRLAEFDDPTARTICAQIIARSKTVRIWED